MVLFIQTKVVHTLAKAGLPWKDVLEQASSWETECTERQPSQTTALPL